MSCKKFGNFSQADFIMYSVVRTLDHLLTVVADTYTIATTKLCIKSMHVSLDVNTLKQ